METRGTLSKDFERRFERLLAVLGRIFDEGWSGVGVRQKKNGKVEVCRLRSAFRRTMELLKVVGTEGCAVG